MQPARRRILLFVVQFLLLFPVCTWLYLRASAPYQDVVLATASGYLGNQSPPTAIERLSDGKWQSYTFDRDGRRVRFYTWEAFVVHLLLLNLALLPALLLSTPAPLGARLRLLLLGFALLFVMHVISAIGLVRLHLDLYQSPDGLLTLAMLRAVYASGQLTTVVLWSLLAWRYWLGRKAVPSAAAKVGRNDPCPCGSGKKYKRCCGP